MTDVLKPDQRAECLLIYDGRCRLCVTAKQGIERLALEPAAKNIRMITYESGEAQKILGRRYRPGRPDVAYLVQPGGDITEGLDAFLPLLPGLRGGRLLVRLLGLPLARPLGYLIYRIVARYRYRLFGEVPLASKGSGKAGLTP